MKKPGLLCWAALLAAVAASVAAVTEEPTSHLTLEPNPWCVPPPEEPETLACCRAGCTGALLSLPKHQVEPVRALRYFPCHRTGCYSSITNQVPVMPLEPKPPSPFPDWQQPLLVEEKPAEEATLSVLQRLTVASSATRDRRTKRSTRKGAPGRRRGKQREGARPVCRGCYSGLTIVAQEGKNESVKWSHSESGEDSSGGT